MSTSDLGAARQQSGEPDQPLPQRIPIPPKVVAVSAYVGLIGIPLMMVAIGVPLVVFQVLALRRKAWAAKANSILFFVFLAVQAIGVFNLAASGPMGRGPLAFVLMAVTMVMNLLAGIVMRQWAAAIAAREAGEVGGSTLGIR
jgi:hypothetical protein